MNRILIFVLLAFSISLLSAVAFAEELPLIKDKVRNYTYYVGSGDDAYGGTERNGEDYVEDGDYHGGNGYNTPGEPGDGDGEGDEDDDEEEEGTILNLIIRGLFIVRLL